MLLDARLASEELALAAAIHSSLMSTALPKASFASIEAVAIPCRAIGGDFFDAVLTRDCIYAVVADVSGKGVPAAIVAAMLQGIIHSQMLANEPIANIADSVNQFLCSTATGKYATMVLLKAHANGESEYLNCGHVSPLLVKGNRVHRLEAGNVVVGLLDYAKYSPAHFRFESGDRMLIFTDGITEAENPAGKPFGGTNPDLLVRLPTVGRIISHVSNFVEEAEQLDDWTVMHLKFLGPNC
jgi:serine phosphatase RsbU (regulator of sigma subunit)